MKVLEPGHMYELRKLDGHNSVPYIIHFVERVGKKYPGNRQTQAGPIIQEYLRVLIDRLYYLQMQRPAWENTCIIKLLRASLWLLEHRAFRMHYARLPIWLPAIERLPTCPICGHLLKHRWSHGSYDFDF